MDVELDGKIMKVENAPTVLRLLKKLSINKEIYLVIVNDRLVTEDHRLNSGDSVKLVKVVSGG
ncbi:MAG: MoaD/ThiS family protein [Syntrophorhabdales bacterium]|jgi:sulfur carrier protein ThiS|nr:MoaD/ThiS family protein [Syntrophorhabdales bacterium]